MAEGVRRAASLSSSLSGTLLARDAPDAMTFGSSSRSMARWSGSGPSRGVWLAPSGTGFVSPGASGGPDTARRQNALGGASTTWGYNGRALSPNSEQWLGRTEPAAGPDEKAALRRHDSGSAGLAAGPAFGEQGGRIGRSLGRRRNRGTGRRRGREAVAREGRPFRARGHLVDSERAPR